MSCTCRINCTKHISVFSYITRLAAVSREEIEEIYERKNYLYLRPEEMKNMRFKVPSNHQNDKEPHASMNNKTKMYNF